MQPKGSSKRVRFGFGVHILGSHALDCSEGDGADEVEEF